MHAALHCLLAAVAGLAIPPGPAGPLAPRAAAAEVAHPAPVAAEQLVGVWSYRWGPDWEGRITFYADGTYWQYDRIGDERSVGTWRLEHGTLHLLDRRLRSRSHYEPDPYPEAHAAAFDGVAPGFLQGLTATGERVHFFEHEEFSRP